MTEMNQIDYVSGMCGGLEIPKTLLCCVYGTLKKGRFWHHLIINEKFIKDDLIVGQLWIDERGLPVFTDGEKDVPVEVYEISEDTFNMLKSFEENAGYETTLIKTKSGLRVYGWKYPISKIKDTWNEIPNY